VSLKNDASPRSRKISLSRSFFFHYFLFPPQHPGTATKSMPLPKDKQKLGISQMKLAAIFITIGALCSSSCHAFTTIAPSPRSSFSSAVAQRQNSELNMGIQEAWMAYNDALESDPLLVKSVTASVILGAADLTGQALEAKQKETTPAAEENTPIDIARTLRFAFFGLVLQAPWNHFYYTILDSAIPPTPEPFTPTTGIKVVIDQFVQAPIFTVLIFAFLGALEGKNLESIKKQLEDDYADTMVANCKYIAV
jgi:peroxisomal membrane protein 2